MNRVFKLPSTSDERRQLVETLTRWCAEVLGSPTRQANIARWMTLEMSELRRVYGNWQNLVKQRTETTTEKGRLFA